MNTSAGCGNIDAFFAPFVGADNAEQFAQRCDEWFVRWAVGLGAGLRNVRRAAQVNAIVLAKLNKKFAEDVGALRLLLALRVECLVCRFCWLGFLALDTPRQGLQQLFRVVKIAAPQEPCAFAGEAKGGIGGKLIVGNGNLLRRRCAAFGSAISPSTSRRFRSS